MFGHSLVKCLYERILDGRSRGGFSLDHGDVDDVNFVIVSGATSVNAFLLYYESNIDADPTDEETVFQEQVHLKLSHQVDDPTAKRTFSDPQPFVGIAVNTM